MHTALQEVGIGEKEHSDAWKIRTRAEPKWRYQCEDEIRAKAEQQWEKRLRREEAARKRRGGGGMGNYVLVQIEEDHTTRMSEQERLWSDGKKLRIVEEEREGLARQEEWRSKKGFEWRQQWEEDIKTGRENEDLE